MNKVELLAPVGSFESLTAAIQGGADAVYFGVGNLNMRSRSSVNFTINDLNEITAVCRKNGIKSYLTLNTIIYDTEIQEVAAILEAVKQSRIDAIIASDFCVIERAHRAGIPVHISTQCNITNIDAVRFYSKFADVMVTARELHLDQVAAIVRKIEQEQIKGPSGELVRIEVFAHGALCMAVSGKCYLSLHDNNHSANRGACFQLCRRAYVVTDKESGTELEIDNEYIMSPKDLCTIGFLDKVLKAGATTLKIEGRGRSADYVKTVTACYKEAINSIADGSYSETKIQAWKERLKTVYNRGFWDGYYLGQTLGEWNNVYGSQAVKEKVYIGKITNYYSKIKVADIKVETRPLSLGDEIMIIGNTTGVYEDVIREMRIDDHTVSIVEKSQLCSIPVHSAVHRGDKLFIVKSKV
ncbi:MAG TPA: peptidase U32 family protein [Bacteroidales bacterium]|nr:peptidase U32 family protein [Bacteroidales bacterium]HQI69289.1 peptidase U32 family protein [Bacteroidales bacterium]